MMRGGETFGDLDGDVDGIRQRQRATANAIGEGLAFVVSHHDEDATVGGLFEAVNRADVRVVEGGGGTGLSQNPLALFFGVGYPFREELEGDGALQFDVESPIHYAHATGPEKAEDLVVSDQITRC